MSMFFMDDRKFNDNYYSVRRELKRGNKTYPHVIDFIKNAIESHVPPHGY